MSFQYGPLFLAMKYGGLFLLNEIDLLDPSTAAGLNS
jgi:cobaltochelatase CobS